MSNITAEAEAKFWSRVDKSGDCWLWTAYRGHNGYGYAYVPGVRASQAHRVAYIITVGPIPEGMVLDHLCRNRACVRPGHLEAVTHAENCRRGAKGRLVTECAHGHPYTPENTLITSSGRRNCRTCTLARNRRWKRARRAAQREAVAE